jgi:ribose 5-phosphate isomerase B
MRPLVLRTRLCYNLILATQVVGERVKVLDKEAIHQMVRRVVYRTLGMPQSSTPATVRPLVTEADVRAVPVGGRLPVPQQALITPLARQIALERRVTLDRTSAAATPSPVDVPRPDPSPTSQQTVAIGADHGGYELKEMLKDYLDKLGYTVVDCGANSTASVDYPDFAFAVARLVAQGRAWRGIVVDGAGIGSCMAANKVPGARAAMCYDQATAVNSREHNDANVLTLGAGLIGPNLAQQIVKTWLETPHGGGRHARRVEKIVQIERRFLKDEPGR